MGRIRIAAYVTIALTVVLLPAGGLVPAWAGGGSAAVTASRHVAKWVFPVIAGWVLTEGLDAAAGKGVAWAEYQRAEGYSRDKDDGKALELYRKAAEQGNANAQFKLMLLYYNGQGHPRAPDKAAQWASRAAEQGHQEAQVFLGALYEDGEGVPQNYAYAVHWYGKAVAKGHPVAQHNLSILYFNGLGVPQDKCQAVYWSRKAAEQGYPAAQYILGLAYAEGLCGSRDLKMADEWLGKAAAQGNIDAQHMRSTLRATRLPGLSEMQNPWTAGLSETQAEMLASLEEPQRSRMRIQMLRQNQEELAAFASTLGKLFHEINSGIIRNTNAVSEVATNEQLAGCGSATTPSAGQNSSELALRWWGMKPTLSGISQFDEQPCRAAVPERGYKALPYSCTIPP